MNEGQEPSCELVVACRNSSKLFELLEETFYKMAFFIQQPIARPRIERVCLWGNAIVRALRLNKLTKLDSSIGFISQNTTSSHLNVAENLGCYGAVMDVPS